MDGVRPFVDCMYASIYGVYASIHGVHDSIGGVY
jgi:hypothetical protein